MTNKELLQTIRSEIERRSDLTSDTTAGRELDEILSFLDSLQQEQQEKGLDVTEFCKPIDPGIAQCVADHWWEMLDGKDAEEKQQEVDLERDAVQFCFDKGLNMTPYQAKTIASHFYELGKNSK